jgi:T-complex protein 1 subunit theta
LEADRVKDVRNIDELQKALKSTIAAKLWGQEDFLAPLVAQACLNVLPADLESFNVDNIRVCKVLGGGVTDSFLVRGFALTKVVEGKFCDLQFYFFGNFVNF